MPKSWFRLGRFVVLALGMCQTEPLLAQVDNADPIGIAFFEARIRPVLVERCYECHSAKAAKIKGGLLLDSRDGLRKGGKSGVALISGQPEQSLLIQALKHDGLKMPPQEKLSEEVIADFVEWVKIGAPDPRLDSAKKAYKTMTLEEARHFWSFQPPRTPTVPKVFGATDEYGLAAAENRVHVHDLHATILHLLGLDHQRLTFRYGGRDQSLTDIHGRVVREILA